MTSITRRLDDNEPVLLVDGKPVAADSSITLPAWAIARLAHDWATVERAAAKATLRRLGFRPPEGGAI
jgi:hypothetical protein